MAFALSVACLHNIRVGLVKLRFNVLTVAVRRTQLRYIITPHDTLKILLPQVRRALFRMVGSEAAHIMSPSL